MDHYVYVYIDPRNHEEFYYGKGKGARKLSHLKSGGDSEKVRRIDAIRAEGLQPIIRVIARGLTSEQALLVEKTLLWKLGKSLLNIATGAYAGNFRPHDKLHVDLSGFDYQSGVYYFNVGEGSHRQWADEVRYGFISAGGGEPQWRESILKFNVGDVFAAYRKRKGAIGGFVGIGKVTSIAKPMREVKIKGRPLATLPLLCKGMAEHIHSEKKCEYVALVDWIKTVPVEQAKWKSGLYTTALVRASLDNQPNTKAYLEEEFGVKFAELAQ
jgi:hypothetical protein